MHNLTTLSASYNSLGKLLENLAADPTIQSSTETHKAIKLALAFYGDMMGETASFFEDYDAMVHALDRANNETIAVETFSKIINEYEALAVNNIPPEMIYNVARTRGVLRTLRLKILRSLFGYDLADALKVEERALGHGYDAKLE